jgi:hypothetical protein
MPYTTHDWECFIAPIYGDDWGMRIGYPHYKIL